MNRAPDIGELLLAWIQADDARAIAASADQVSVALGMRDNAGRTPLMAAAAMGSLRACSALLDLGAGLDEVDDSGLSARDYLRNLGAGAPASPQEMGLRAEILAALMGATIESAPSADLASGRQAPARRHHEDL